jgi:hypothetical protein
VSGEGRATVKQIYALAAVLCERAGGAFPQTRAEASAMLDRLKGKTTAAASAGDNATPAAGDA